MKRQLTAFFMVARAAALCGADTALGADAARNILCVFSDYTTVSSYAASSMKLHSS